MRWHRVAVAALGVLAGCHDDAQSFREGMALICAAETASGAAHASPAARARIVADWVKVHVHNHAALTVFEELGQLSGPDGADHIAAAASRAGLAACPLVAMMGAPP
ncbi:MAG: hypothetical protein R3B06_04085 [Kofleriaceae bacterium]